MSWNFARSRDPVMCPACLASLRLSTVVSALRFISLGGYGRV
jgi:hypothetical protein